MLWLWLSRRVLARGSSRRLAVPWPFRLPFFIFFFQKPVLVEPLDPDHQRNQEMYAETHCRSKQRGSDGQSNWQRSNTVSDVLLLFYRSV